MGISEDLESKIAKGFAILEGRDPYDYEVYFSPSEAAEKIFIDVLESCPSSYRALLGLGMCVSTRPHEEQTAFDIFRKVISLNPEVPEAYYENGVTLIRSAEAGRALSREKAYSEAIYYLQQALSRGYPLISWLYYHMGLASYRLADYTSALERFRKAAAACENECTWIPAIFRLAGQACEALGKVEEAIFWYKKLRKELITHESELESHINNLMTLIRAGKGRT